VIFDTTQWLMTTGGSGQPENSVKPGAGSRAWATGAASRHMPTAAIVVVTLRACRTIVASLRVLL
jgi:hypothetical protein